MPRIKQRVEVREVDYLFDANRIFEQTESHVTPEVVAFYKARIPYAFAIERQSAGLIVLGDPGKTGHEGRVDVIQRMAAQLGCHLPVPIPRKDRADGELEYEFDSAFWFLDGEEGPATGFSSLPEARPELWRAYAIARRLKELDPSAAPIAFLFADGTRFFRDDHWLKAWARAIQSEGIAIYAQDAHNKIEGIILDVEAMKVRLLSEHLPQYRAAARQTRKRRGQLFHGNTPFGLQFNEEKDEVWTHPLEWEVIWEVAHRLADGRLTSARGAGIWIAKNYAHRVGEMQDKTAGPGRSRLPITDAWVRKVLAEGSFVEGTYHAYTKRWKACKIKERSGFGWEIDLTDQGRRRYVTELLPQDEWVPFPIHYTGATAPIPREVLESARRAMSQRGHPRAETPQHRHRLCIAPPRLVRCSACGAQVLERCPARDEPRGPWPGWSLQCRCSQDIQRKYGITAEEARQHPDAQHRRYRQACLAQPLQALLREKLFEDEIDLEPVNPGTRAAHRSDRLRELETIKTETQVALDRQVALISSGRVNLSLPAVAASFNKEFERLQSQLDEVERELQLMAARTLQHCRTNESLRELRRLWKDLEPAPNLAFWRTVVETLVEKIVVDLEAGTFTVAVKISQPDLRVLHGELG